MLGSVIPRPERNGEPGIHDHNSRQIFAVGVDGFRVRRFAAPRNDDPCLRHQDGGALQPALAQI